MRSHAISIKILSLPFRSTLFLDPLVDEKLIQSEKTCYNLKARIRYFDRRSDKSTSSARTVDISLFQLCFDDPSSVRLSLEKLSAFSFLIHSFIAW